MPEDQKPQPKAENIAQNLQNLANAFQWLANEAVIPNVPGLDPMSCFWMSIKQKQSIQENQKLLQQQQELLEQVRKELNQLQKEVQRTRKEVSQSSIMSVRSHNSMLSKLGIIKYPPGTPVSPHPLPMTKGELLQMNSLQCQLIAGQLGLPILPGPTSVKKRRKQIADYLGVSCQCTCM